MKLLFFGLFLVGICNAGSVMPEKLRDFPPYEETMQVYFQGYINKIRREIKDPIDIADKNIEVPFSDLASGHFEIIDFVEKGLKGLDATNITVVVASRHTRVYVTLNIPGIDINTNYDADILLASLIPIYGNGLANINLKNLKLDLNSGYNLSFFNIATFDDLSCKLSIDSATFDLHGVMNNEALSATISQILNETFAPFINNYSELLCKLFRPFLENILNELFAERETSELSAI